MPRRFPRPLLGLAACVMLTAGSFAVLAQDTQDTTASDTAAESDMAAETTAPTPEQILAGKRIWADAACYNCHGVNGQGGRSKDFPRGPSLRTSTLDNELMYEIIACGIPGTQMPGWAKGAYTEHPCFGETGPVPEGTRVLGLYDDQQLTDLLAYINATFRPDWQD